ncbi:MAG: ABC transporter permease [bacterium]
MGKTEAKKSGVAGFMKIFQSQQAGLLFIIIALGAILTYFARYTDPATGQVMNKFFNANTLIQTMTDASFFAIMAVGATAVIISCGIDLSVGSVYALSGVAMAMTLRSIGPAMDTTGGVFLAMAICLGIGIVAGLINGTLVVSFKVHPFIITLGSMMILRGVAFRLSKAESILVPDALTGAVKAHLGLGNTLSPLPMIVMLVVMVCGEIYLTRTVAGRHIFAVGGNEEASHYAGLRLNRIKVGIYAMAGLCAGIAAFTGTSFYGAASCADATGYELYVIASAVVGGASLTGGKGSAVSAVLGAIIITLIRQSIRTLNFNQDNEMIIIGAAIIIAVVIDQTSARKAAKRLAQRGPEAK